MDVLVKLRNHLAHDYLTKNYRLLKNAEARRMLIIALQHYREVFEEAVLQT
jgi:hypothetical protein